MAKKQAPQREIFAEGKTKTIFRIREDLSVGFFMSKDDITKDDDPAKTRILEGKGAWANTTTCNVFELIRRCGLPVSYLGKTMDREFSSELCEMILLEVVIRRNKVGSYLERFPNFKHPKDLPPLRSHQLVFELFLKTNKGKVKNRFGDLVAELPIDPKKNLPLDDPFIIDPAAKIWELYWPKKPSWEKGANLGITVEDYEILPPGVTVAKIEEISRKCFLVLESAWASLGYRLIDFKIELGINRKGQLVISDVIDNDSWRLRDANWNELSKQLFRDNDVMEKIAYNYAKVAELTNHFNISNQALVVWRGSNNDPILEVPEIPGIDVVNVIVSGHKSPNSAMEELEKIINNYPGGGVVIAEVGMSNGLGPTLSARTNWPLISYAISGKSFPEDIWSSVRMPSEVPNLTVMDGTNAVSAALNILARKNPAAYMYRQYAIEKLDK
ncbi:MAG: hypothetical protein ACD_11C00115G0023 [uncultured bacterium]|nr:MAG: hypothetical protein ACD_11C00115G0023 [uncultured bacterium]HBR72097.1 hypothetical protein [Candidatus Moranbacteria bacterium]